MADSPYFDGTYFDSTYFDTDTIGGGKPPRGPRFVVTQPDVPLIEDEELLTWIT